ncbi:MAG: NADH-quinone oxidoreductase subunit A [Planctomycetes bacterium]|jgi:NADH-quinone oxidoreductase subunit A|nr:NADH-quinone oxidoreductase subunit A [Planctomycetota bacterium]
MYFDYLNVLVFACVGLVFVFANLLIASIVRPKRKTTRGLEVYECGEEPIGGAWIQFDIRYYTVALVYVIFAVEIAFLFPWAIVLGDAMAGEGAAAGTEIGLFALVEGLLFILILFLGLAYVWAKGDLDWVLSYSGPKYAPPTHPDRAVPGVEELEAATTPSEQEAGGETAA